jgi:uncharacterized membrane protein YfcA
MRILIVVLAMAVGAFLKGVTGSGLPVVAIPVMATFVGVEEAVVIMTIPGVVTNTWLVWRHRSFRSSTRDLPALLAGGVVGVSVGAWLLTNLDNRVLGLVLAGVIGLYVLTLFVNPHFRLPPQVTRLTSLPVGLAAGTLQGATGISGPLLATYLHAYRLAPQAYVLSVTTAFQVFALAQVGALAALHLYTLRRLVLSLLALIPTMAALPLGARVAGRVSPRVFDAAVLLVLLGSAAKLVFDAVAR